MGVGKQITEIADATSKQINAVNIITWVLYPALIGLLLTIIIIIFIWTPKFSGTFEYQQCQGKGGEQTCETKTGSRAKRNIVIICLMILIIPSIFGSLGFQLGFAINNPKMFTGIYATNAFVKAFR